jgi:hypothetical protein
MSVIRTLFLFFSFHFGKVMNLHTPTSYTCYPVQQSGRLRSPRGDTAFDGKLCTLSWVSYQGLDLPWFAAGLFTAPASSLSVSPNRLAKCLSNLVRACYRVLLVAFEAHVRLEHGDQMLTLL